MKKAGLALIILFIGVFVACSSESKTAEAAKQTPPKATKKDPVLYTGKPCFERMLSLAQRWQADALPFHLESVVNAESNGRDGKSTIWKGMFASASTRRFKTFTCSGSQLRGEAAAGVSSTPEAAYGPNVPSLMFSPFYLMTDSDAAFELAQQKGGAKLLEKDPQRPVVYVLGWDPRQKQLVWVVIYGTDLQSAKGSGVIDASTGKFLRASK